MATRLPRAEQQRRDFMIVAAHTRGFSQIRIAENIGVTERTVRRVIKRWYDALPALDEIDPIQELRDELLRINAAIDELAVMRGSRTMKGADRVRAIRAQMGLLKQIREINERLGLFPAPDAKSRASKEALGREFCGWVREYLAEKNWDVEMIQFFDEMVREWLRRTT